MRRILLLSLIAIGCAYGDESQLQLKEGTGKQAVEANCSICHSLDYIQINSIFLDRKGWAASVNKMIKVMGAPVSDQDAPLIIDYLTRNYGRSD